MIIILGGEKGGTGKTTLATNLAAMRVMNGHDVLLVDTDKQESANYWAYTRNENQSGNHNINCSTQFGGSVLRVAQDHNKIYEDIIVDAGGRNSSELRATMTIADALYIPIQPSQFDIWTLARMDELVRLARNVNPNIRAEIVINRASTNPSVSEVFETIQLFKDYEQLQFSGIVIRDRISYRKAASLGLSITELSPSDPKALEEMELFYQKVYYGKTIDVEPSPQF